MTNKRTLEGIAFVTLNNPYAKRRPPHLCTNICDDNNWSYEGFANVDKGFTYCCEVNELRSKIPTIPLLRVEKVLKFEKK